MDILRYNNITKKIDVLCTFDSYTDTNIPAGIGVYNAKFTEKLKSYIEKMMSNIATIVSAVRTDYESSQIFTVTDSVGFSVSDESGNKIIEIAKDGSDFLVKINKETIISNIIAETITSENGTDAKDINVSSFLKITDGTTGVFKFTTNGVSFVDAASPLSEEILMSVTAAETNVGKLKVANNLNVDGTITTGNITVAGIMSADDDGVTFEKPLIINEGIYFGSVSEGNKFLTSEELESKYAAVEEMISTFESKMSSYFAALNMPNAKIALYSDKDKTAEGIYIVSLTDLTTKKTVLQSGYNLYIDSASPDIELTLANETENSFIKSLTIDFSDSSNAVSKVAVNDAVVYAYTDGPVMTGIARVSAAHLSTVVNGSQIDLEKLTTYGNIRRIKLSITLTDLSGRTFDSILDIKVG